MENLPTRRFTHCPEEVYLNRDTIETLYHLLSVKVHLAEFSSANCSAFMLV